MRKALTTLAIALTLAAATPGDTHANPTRPVKATVTTTTVVHETR